VKIEEKDGEMVSLVGDDYAWCTPGAKILCNGEEIVTVAATGEWAPSTIVEMQGPAEKVKSPEKRIKGTVSGEWQKEVPGKWQPNKHEGMIAPADGLHAGEIGVVIQEQFIKQEIDQIARPADVKQIKVTWLDNSVSGWIDVVQTSDSYRPGKAKLEPAVRTGVSVGQGDLIKLKAFTDARRKKQRKPLAKCYPPLVLTFSVLKGLFFFTRRGCFSCPLH
jgi:hypothetical protein